ncbi:MAG TPA: hypothetical protein VK614_05045 [Allosphingosinicella sp.]|nr:hypothetical protein [Allosphingosinicella sp.]
MSLETRKEKFLYQVVVPVIGAILGAIAATWFQSASIDKAQLQDVIHLLRDPLLTAPQKLQALEVYKEITDRPWSIIRSLVTTLTMTISIAIGAMVAGGFFMRRN